MNKKLRELLAAMDAKATEAQKYMDGENKDVAKATALMDEYDALKAEFDAEKRLFEAEKARGGEGAAAAVVEKEKATCAEEFAKAISLIASGQTKLLAEGTLVDGGYLVPEDIQTQVQKYKEAAFDLKTLVDVEPVSTNKGARTFQQKADVEGLQKVDEGGAIPEQTAPKFERLTYSIEDYAGYIPLTNDLIEDNNPTHITEVVTEWLARASVACDNREILAAIKTKDETALKGLDDIKKSINVTLGQAYASAAIIVTNDDGLNYLDTLKDTTGRDLLNPDPTAPANMRLRIGANLIPVKVVPNTVLKTTTNKVPFIIGDLKEAVKFFDRQKVTLKASDIATVGGKSAFESNLTYIRAIERMNVKVKDKNAFVNGFITVGE